MRMQQRIQALESELDERNARISLLTKQYALTQRGDSAMDLLKQLQEMEAALERERGDHAAATAKLQAQARDLEATVAQLRAAPAAPAAADADIRVVQLQCVVEAKDRELSALRALLAGDAAAPEARDAQLQQLRLLLAARDREIADLKAAADADSGMSGPFLPAMPTPSIASAPPPHHSELERKDHEIAVLKATLAERESSRAAAPAPEQPATGGGGDADIQVLQLRCVLEAKDREIGDLRAQLGEGAEGAPMNEREAELELADREIAALRRRIAALEGEVMGYRAQAAAGGAEARGGDRGESRRGHADERSAKRKWASEKAELQAALAARESQIHALEARLESQSTLRAILGDSYGAKAALTPLKDGGLATPPGAPAASDAADPPEGASTGGSSDSWRIGAEAPAKGSARGAGAPVGDALSSEVEMAQLRAQLAALKEVHEGLELTSGQAIQALQQEVTELQQQLTQPAMLDTMPYDVVAAPPALEREVAELHVAKAALEREVEELRASNTALEQRLQTMRDIHGIDTSSFPGEGPAVEEGAAAHAEARSALTHSTGGQARGGGAETGDNEGGMTSMQQQEGRAREQVEASPGPAETDVDATGLAVQRSEASGVSALQQQVLELRRQLERRSVDMQRLRAGEGAAREILTSQVAALTARVAALVKEAEQRELAIQSLTEQLSLRDLELNEAQSDLEQAHEALLQAVDQTKVQEALSAVLMTDDSSQPHSPLSTASPTAPKEAQEEVRWRDGVCQADELPVLQALEERLSEEVREKEAALRELETCRAALKAAHHKLIQAEKDVAAATKAQLDSKADVDVLRMQRAELEERLLEAEACMAGLEASLDAANAARAALERRVTELHALTQVPPQAAAAAADVRAAAAAPAPAAGGAPAGVPADSARAREVDALQAAVAAARGECAERTQQLHEAQEALEQAENDYASLEMRMQDQGRTIDALQERLRVAEAPAEPQWGRGVAPMLADAKQRLADCEGKLQASQAAQQSLQAALERCTQELSQKDGEIMVLQGEVVSLREEWQRERALSQAMQAAAEPCTPSVAGDHLDTHLSAMSSAPFGLDTMASEAMKALNVMNADDVHSDPGDP